MSVNANVEHPHHYTQSCSLECIDVMVVIFGVEKVIDYCLINAFKYMWRFKDKGGMEDLDKADWYLRWAYANGLIHKDGFNRVDRYRELRGLCDKLMMEGWEDDDELPEKF